MRGIPCFFGAFSLLESFSRDFRDSVGIQNPFFRGGGIFLASSQQPRKDRQRPNGTKILSVVHSLRITNLLRVLRLGGNFGLKKNSPLPPGILTKSVSVNPKLNSQTDASETVVFH